MLRLIDFRLISVIPKFSLCYFVDFSGCFDPPFVLIRNLTYFTPMFHVYTPNHPPPSPPKKTAKNREKTEVF